MKTFLFLILSLFAQAAPPHAIPPHLYGAFTLENQIRVSSFYRDDSYPPDHPIVYEFEEVENLKQKALRKEENYYGPTDSYLYAALDQYPIRGKKVAIMGSNIPWYEAVVLAYGGQPTTIEYNKIISKHPDVRTMTVAEYGGELFDVVISISSFEHDGLGRYGDPIHPSGDLVAMQKAKQMLRPGGLLFLAVPVGPDLLVWNAHRVYGPIRLPLLLEGWETVESFGFDYLDFFKQREDHQPVFVLKPHSPKKIFAIGDSHTRVFHGIEACSTIHVGPMLMHRVGRDSLDIRKHGVEEDSVVIYVFGEIDARFHIGKQRDLENRELDEIINTLASNYIRAVVDNQSQYKRLQSVVFGVVPPSISEHFDPSYPFHGTIEDRVAITQKLNQALKSLCDLNGIPFLDIYDDYADPSGILRKELSDGNVHIDAHHNQPLQQKLYQLLSQSQDGGK